MGKLKFLRGDEGFDGYVFDLRSFRQDVEGIVARSHKENDCVCSEESIALGFSCDLDRETRLKILNELYAELNEEQRLMITRSLINLGFS